MSLIVSAGILVVTSAAIANSWAVAQSACAASPRRDLLPKVIAPSAGASPIWFVDGGGGTWQGVGVPVKSVWILERKIAGALRVTGRHAQSNQTLTFRRGLDGPVTASLEIAEPFTESMTPGGASRETMQKFAFVSSYVLYPSPGCWEMEAQLGDRLVKTVVEARRR